MSVIKFPIKLLILDVDGVLTDGKIWLNHQGEEHKSFHVHDGMGMKNLLNTGIQIAVISSRTSKVVSLRMQELGIQHYYQGQENKVVVFKQLLNTLNIAPENVAYVGDDLPDISVMKLVGFRIAVANAVSEIHAIADWQTSKKGGEGAVREACDFILSQMNGSLLKSAHVEKNEIS